MTEPSRNGHTPPADEPALRANPYADAMAGGRPPELTEFDLHTDPYANMIPRVSSVTPIETEDLEDARPRKPHPVMVIVSLLLVAVLILPIMAEVFIRLMH